MSRQWKAPYRPTNEISQTFNSGVVAVYSVENVAAPGLKPVEKLKIKGKFRYDEQRLGIQRYYSGRQNQVEIERVIRVPRTDKISTQDVAITEDGHQYRIDVVQAAIDIFPPSADVTLARIDQNYEVEDGEMV